MFLPDGIFVSRQPPQRSPRLLRDERETGMDARITKSTATYKLVNKTSGKVEASGMGRIDAQDQRNLFWAVGVKTDLVQE